MIPTGSISHDNSGVIKFRFESFNCLFTAWNVSTLLGNKIQVDDEVVILTVVLPDGTYSIGGSGDIGMAIASALTLLTWKFGGAN